MSFFTLLLILILTLLIIFISVILFARLKVCITAEKKDGEKAVFDAAVYLPGGIRLSNTSDKKKKNKKTDKKAKPKKTEKNAEKKESFSDKAKKFYRAFTELKYTYKLSKRRIRKNILCDKIFLDISFGLSDAAKTGMATGAVWAAVYNITGFLSRIITLRQPEINISPVFDGKHLEFKAECIFIARGVNLINIMASLGINYLKSKRKLKKYNKGGE